MLPIAMSGIRPLQRDDVPAAAALFERTVGTGSSPAGLESLFSRLLFEDPWQDPELPSLAYEGEDGALAGFLSRTTRRMRWQGEPFRMSVSLHFAVSPEARGQAVGALLAARMLGGKQDGATTEHAIEQSRRLWEGLKGRRLALQSLEWTRVLRPASYWQGRLARGGGALGAATRPLARPLDALAPRLPGGGAPARMPEGLTDEPLTPDVMVAQLGALAGWADLRPDYDVPFLRWLFQMLADTPSFGDLSARLVRRDGEPIGWHLSLIEPGGHAELLQLLAPPDETPAVFDALLAHAHARGAVAARGRLEPPLLDAISRDRSVLRRGGTAMLRTRAPEPFHAVLDGRALLTRLDANGWVDVRGR
jgi:hypothetical protein